MARAAGCRRGRRAHVWARAAYTCAPREGRESEGAYNGNNQRRGELLCAARRPTESSVGGGREREKTGSFFSSPSERPPPRARPLITRARLPSLSRSLARRPELLPPASATSPPAAAAAACPDIRARRAIIYAPFRRRPDSAHSKLALARAPCRTPTRAPALSRVFVSPRRRRGGGGGGTSFPTTAMAFLPTFLPRASGAPTSPCLFCSRAASLPLLLSRLSSLLLPPSRRLPFAQRAALSLFYRTSSRGGRTWRYCAPVHVATR